MGNCGNNCGCNSSGEEKKHCSGNCGCGSKNDHSHHEVDFSSHMDSNSTGKKFHIVVFGCQMNYSDSARIKSVLQNCGWQFVDSIDEAEIVIFDTCSVRQKSEDKVTGKMKEIDPAKKVWITGCMVQHNLRNAKISANAKGRKLKGLTRKGNFVGTVETIDPAIAGWTNEEIKEGLKSIDRPHDEIVFVNNAFNPMYYNLKKNYDNLELIFRIDDTGFLPLMMRELGYEVEHDVEMTNEYSSIIPQGTNQLMKTNTKTAFVPISTGCSQFCAFCIVPYARGIEKHFPVDQIIEEVEHHLANGIEEITLLGQIVNKHPQFVEICQKILALPQNDKYNLKWLRYTSPYPTHYDDDLLQLHEEEERMCPHIHIPLQSGSSTILKKMFRGYNAEQFNEFIDKIRGLDRPISITTDIIVGFTDETEEDFQDTLAMVEYGRFDMVYIGKYSVRPGTFAARKYADNVSREDKHDRWDRLNELLKKISAENNQEEHDTVRTIMVNRIENDRIGGYADNMKNVIISVNSDEGIVNSDGASVVSNNAPKGKKGGLSEITLGDRTVKLGDFVDVKIIGSEQFKLYGELI